MRLGILSQEYPPVTDYHGGIGTQYGRLAPAVASLGHEVHVITLAPEAGAPPAELNGVRIHPVQRPRLWPWFELAWARRVDSVLSELGEFDLVISPEFRGEAFTYSKHQRSGPLVTHLLTSLAQLLSIRPGLPWRERNGVRTRIGLLAERRQAQRSSGLLAPGGAVLGWADQLWSLGGLPRETLPLAIDVSRVRDLSTGPPPEDFPSESGPIVMLPSRLDGHKGAQHLVAAMHGTWREHPDAQLVFLGRDAPFGGRMMSEHLREAARDRRSQVHILGFQPDHHYFAALARADVVAIPSLWESYCLAAVEAMALGRPVIGTTGNGFSEFIESEENGLLVERGSVTELQAGVQRLLDDQALRERLGKAATETADRHDARELAPRYADVCERLASGARA